MLDLDVANKIPSEGQISLEELSKELEVDREFLSKHNGPKLRHGSSDYPLQGGFFVF
jgi:hypothetical protein